MDYIFKNVGESPRFMELKGVWRVKGEFFQVLVYNTITHVYNNIPSLIIQYFVVTSLMATFKREEAMMEI